MTMLVFDDFSFLGYIIFKWCFFKHVFLLPPKEIQVSPGAGPSTFFRWQRCSGCGQLYTGGENPRESKASGESGWQNSNFLKILGKSHLLDRQVVGALIKNQAV